MTVNGGGTTLERGIDIGCGLSPEPSIAERFLRVLGDLDPYLLDDVHRRRR